MTQDEYNDLVNTVQQLTEKTNALADSIARVDTKVENTKYVTRLLDVNVQYPAENDILVYDKTGKWKNAQYDEIGLQPGEGGESDIYIIGIGDETSPTNENVYAAARTIEDFLSSKNTDIAEGTITFNSGLVTNNITSLSSSEGSFGSGLIYKIKSDGKAYMELDELLVRTKASFNSVEIKKIYHVGGNIVLTPASIKCNKVERKSTMIDGQSVEVFRCYFADRDGDEAITNDFQVNDLARCQQFNIQEGIYDGVSNKYYWRKVVGVGANYIDLSVNDRDTSSNDEPSAGDEIIQFGNVSLLARQNAIDLSSYGEESPSIRLYQGINGYSLENRAIIEMAYDTDQSQQQAYMNVYGRMYIGAKDKSAYVQFDPTQNGGRGKVTIKAEVEIISGSGYDNLTDKPDIDGMINNATDVINDDFAKTLGYSNYDDMVDKAKELGTIISGGYIRTSLVHADQLITTDLLASTISSGGKDLNINGNFIVKPDGSFTCNKGTINQEVIINGNISGAKGTIGGFAIGSNELSAKINEDNYMTLSSKQIIFSTDNVRVNISAQEQGAIYATARTSNVNNLLYLDNTSKLAITINGNMLNSGVVGYNAWMTPAITLTSCNMDVNNAYIFRLNSLVTDYYFPTIQQFLSAFSRSISISYFFSNPLIIPIYFLSDPQYSNQKSYKIHFGSGKQVTDRPIIVAKDGATGTEITMDHQSHAMYLLYIYDGASITSSGYRGVLKEVYLAV